MKSTLIIWSKDRACQLEMYLNSIKNNSSIDFDINIIYTYSSDLFKSNYEKLILEYNYIKWIKEKDFRNDTLKAIGDGYNNIFFSTDDCIFWRKEPFFDFNIEQSNCFSLRLGMNTLLQCEERGEYQPSLQFYTEGDKYISWNIDRINPYYNYGYLGLDGHGYNKNQILNILNEINFKNSNELEGNLQKYRNQFYTFFSHFTSCVLSIPLNCLSGQTAFSPKPEHTIEYLNRQFSFGKRLRLIPNQKIIGCHQLLSLHWS